MRVLPGHGTQVSRAATIDLVCYFDCLHDMGDPVGAAQHAYESLKPDGTVLLVEPFANDSLDDNINPVGRLFYAASTFICTPNSLSQEVGLGLGAQAGERGCARCSPRRASRVPPRDGNAVQPDSGGAQVATPSGCCCVHPGLLITAKVCGPGFELVERQPCVMRGTGAYRQERGNRFVSVRPTHLESSRSTLKDRVHEEPLGGHDGKRQGSETAALRR